MSYGNYLQGSTDTTNNTYNLLISGAPSGYTSSGINIGGDTSTTYGVKITSDSSHNAFMDVRGDASNKIAFRYKDQTSGTVTAMLDLTNDSSLTGSGYGATVNGRVNASSYYVGSVDTRAPTSSGVYMGMDGNVGYFNVNKGSGTGGFAFKTYNADGSLYQSNLNLLASGVVQASYYTSSGHADDSESVAVAGFDASGNLVRNYQSNARFRAIEARLTAAESSVSGPVSSKVNEVINRLNGLNFFSQNIETLSGVTASTSPSPAPVSTDPTLVYYYPTKTGDVNGTQLADYKTGTKTFNATLSASGMFSSVNPGSPNSGSILFSNNNFITLPSLTIQPFASTSGGISFSMWFKCTTAPSSLGYTLFEFAQSVDRASSTSETFQFSIGLTTLSNQILVSYANGPSGGGQDVQYNYATSPTPFTDWTHLVLTMTNGTRPTGYTIYINGTVPSGGLGAGYSSGSQTTPTYPLSGTYPYVTLGSTNYDAWNGLSFFQGNMANFRFYNKLLSSTDVSNLYSQKL